MEQLAVWAERLEEFVRVGTLWFERGGEEWFEYDGSYLQRGDATPIYPSLPLGDGASTTHILKVGSSSFPNQMLNEAVSRAANQL